MNRLVMRSRRLKAMTCEVLLRRAAARGARAGQGADPELLADAQREEQVRELAARLGRRHPAVQLLMATYGISEAWLDWMDAAIKAQKSGEDLDAWFIGHPAPECTRSERGLRAAPGTSRHRSGW